MGELKSSGKPFDIPKSAVWEAYQRVKANKGAAGVDGESIEDFEVDLKNNLYRLWNRMSSGSYFPPPVRAVEIPKSGGGVRVLGVPTVSDRIAQTVAAAVLEAKVEPIFHPDSYGYRTHRSALHAVGTCRKRCWSNDWVVDLDIRKFFDSVPWTLMIKAVTHHLGDGQDWVLLYVRRWLQAPLRQTDGSTLDRDRGTPQGSAISPVLANLFMHYAFDVWMAREFPTIGFERYVDDAVVHCTTLTQARMLVTAIGQRMEQIGLSLHPDKTKVVYCGRRRGGGSQPEHTAFTFLGYTFRARAAIDRRGEVFTSYLPAISADALKRLSTDVRGWRLHQHSTYSLNELARWINPIVAGWMNYYGAFYKTALYPLLKRINAYLVRWARKKYRRLHGFKKAKAWWEQVTKRDPLLFAQWKWVHSFW
jgi:RNA-directed DNA polymerase